MEIIVESVYASASLHRVLFNRWANATQRNPEGIPDLPGFKNP